ncbi:hypothetical protein E2C01_003741 [Portunus trituberculatus]|uniref:Uncharacterized protein n=1 Tax=Portunus trituberculatus TaxID=210409 RepID=A0A5B7CS16_PORTR|nr:hypothetical protein [Portunus trituberculatus]
MVRSQRQAQRLVSPPTDQQYPPPPRLTSQTISRIIMNSAACKNPEMEKGSRRVVRDNTLLQCLAVQKCVVAKILSLGIYRIDQNRGAHLRAYSRALNHTTTRGASCCERVPRVCQGSVSNMSPCTHAFMFSCRSDGQRASVASAAIQYTSSLTEDF